MTTDPGVSVRLRGPAFAGLLVAGLLVAGVLPGAFGGARSAGAQPAVAGDWIVSDFSFNHGGVIALNPTEIPPAKPTSIMVGQPAGYINWVSMHPDNAFLLANYSVLQLFGVIDTGGKFTTFVQVKDSPNGHAKAEDGDIFVSTSGQNEVLKVGLARRSATLFNRMKLPPTVNNITIDRDTGDLIVGSYQGGTLVALDRSTGLVKRTLATGLGLLTGVDYDPVTGGFYVTTLSSPELRRVERTGIVTTIAAFNGANACKVDEETGNILVCGLSRVAMLRPNGTIVPGRDHTQPQNPIAYNFSSVEVYGSSKLSGRGPATPGTSYALALRFPLSPNRQYVTAASLTGLRRGVRLPDGRIVNLAFDALTTLCLQNGGIPGLFDRFVGVLDGAGRPVGGGPVIRIPAGAPVGLRLFIAAVAVNPGFPSGLDVSNAWSVAVR